MRKTLTLSGSRLDSFALQTQADLRSGAGRRPTGWPHVFMVIVFPVLIAIVGLLLYALASNPKISEIGRILFFAGTLATLLRFTPAITLIR